MARRRTFVGAGLLLALTFAAGCSLSSTAAPGPTSSVAPAPAPAPSTTTTTTTSVRGQVPSAGCSTTGSRSSAGQSARTQMTAGVAHRYLLSIPTSYRPATPTPLALLFHGFGSDGRSFAALTRMPAAGARRGVIVVTPDGPDHTWQLSGTGTDAAFVDAILATLSKSLCVDLHRVYATGFSQGAAFTIFYSCARPGRIAAFATVAVDFQLGCKQPVPYLAFHGTVDPAVPYDNGAIGVSLPGKVRGTLLNMTDWARLDRCASTPTTRTVTHEVTLRAWPRCADDTAVELYTIINGSHTWPGADPKASPLYTTQEIDATALMLDFFAAHQVTGK